MAVERAAERKERGEMPAKHEHVNVSIPTELGSHLPNTHVVRQTLPGVTVNGRPITIEHTVCRDVATCIGMNCGHAHVCHTERGVGYGVIDTITLTH